VFTVPKQEDLIQGEAIHICSSQGKPYIFGGPWSACESEAIGYSSAFAAASSLRRASVWQKWFQPPACSETERALCGKPTCARKIHIRIGIGRRVINVSHSVGG
jgi:hypothetical protein